MLTILNIATLTGIFWPLLRLAKSITHIQKLRQIMSDTLQGLFDQVEVNNNL